MLGRVAADVGDALRQAVTHADYAELGDGVLLEEFAHEGCGVTEGEEVAGRTHVGFIHRDRAVNDEDEVADYAALEGGGVFEFSGEMDWLVIMPSEDG